MKKVFATILALAMIFTLVACGAKNDSSAVNDKGVVEGSNKSASGETDKDVYIDMWGTYDDGNARAEFLIQKGQEFAEKYEAETGISVTFEYYSQNDYGGCATKLAAGVAGGDLPVLCQISSQNCPAFESLCADLRDYMDADAIANYQDGLMVGCVGNDGKVFAVPGGRSYACYIVNMDLVKKAGYTEEDVANWDFDKFHEIMLAISKLGDDIDGCGLWWDTDAWMFESSLYANGGNVDNEEATKVTFQEDNAGGIYLDLVTEMMADGSMLSVYNNFVPKDVGNELTTRLAAGKLGCRMGSITNYGDIKAAVAELPADQQFEVYVANQPAGKGGFSVVTGGNNYLFLNNSTETQKKVAAAYLEYLAEDENCAAWNELSGYMAFTKSVYTSDAYAEVTKDPNMVRIGDGIQYAHRRPMTQNWAEMRKYLMDCLPAFSQDPAGYIAANGGSSQAVVNAWAEKCQQIMDANS